MRIVQTAEFEHSLQKLSAGIQRLCAAQIEYLRRDRHDPRLHIKKLHGLEGVYSFRVTRSYRALFYFDREGDLILFDIDDRKDVYR
ncbi:hypothetical protein HY416_02155 [Candidatus Kaiserbacteria bacterium]|nr:hypothetical protein [Candidatus Kaiserbacteria bacterium]